MRAAERALAAAHAERLPSVTRQCRLRRDRRHHAGCARHVLRSPAEFACRSGKAARAEGEIQQAEAAVRQRRAELDDLSSQIEGDVRKAYLDLEAAASQVEVALRNQSSRAADARPDAPAI